MFQTDTQSSFSDEIEEPSVWDLLKNELDEKLEQTTKEIQEIRLLIDQSKVEVSKLTDRNKSVNSNLQRVQAQIDTLPREDIRTTYDSALDSQQRLLVMRGQLEKLQSDEKNLAKHVELMERVGNALEGGAPQETKTRSAFGAVEMMIQGQESERQKLSRQMHDGPAQALSNFILQTEIAMRLFDMDPDKARNELGNLKSAATTTFQQVREFIFELRPMMLDDLGFIPTIKRYVDALNEQDGADISVQVAGMERRLESYLEVLVFRSIQELLGNASRHSGATQIVVKLDIGDKELKTVVEDNGNGFDPAPIMESEANLGLRLIKERVEMVGGDFNISSVPGQGTQVTFLIPIGATKGEPG